MFILAYSMQIFLNLICLTLHNPSIVLALPTTKLIHFNIYLFNMQISDRNFADEFRPARYMFNVLLYISTFRDLIFLHYLNRKQIFVFYLFYTFCNRKTESDITNKNYNQIKAWQKSSICTLRIKLCFVELFPLIFRCHIWRVISRFRAGMGKSLEISQVGW